MSETYKPMFQDPRARTFVTTRSKLIVAGPEALGCDVPWAPGAGAYDIGDCIGEAIQIPVLDLQDAKGILQSIILQDSANQKQAIDILIFGEAPKEGTYQNDAAVAISTDRLQRVVSVAAADWKTIGSDSVAYAQPSFDPFLIHRTDAVGSENIYVVLMSQGTPTFGANSNLRISFGVLTD